MLVAPAEDKRFLTLSPDGQYSSLPETNGVDFLLFLPDGMAGVQRKACADFVASVRDGRIGDFLRQSLDLTYRVLLVEGDWRWDKTGRCKLHGYDHGFLKTQYDGIVMSMQRQGVYVMTSRDVEDSVVMLRQIEEHLSRPDGTSLLTRPKPSYGMTYGPVKARLEAIHFLSGFAGISQVTAAAIYDHFGCIPLAWQVTEKELWQVPGIGPKRAKQLLNALPTTTDRGKGH